MTEIRSPLQAHIVQWHVRPGDAVNAGDLLVILEAMKMEHEVRAAQAGRVGELFFEVGALVAQGEALLDFERVTPSSKGLDGKASFPVRPELVEGPKPVLSPIPSSKDISGTGRS